MHSTIYKGTLAHVREKPRRNAFRYGVYMLYLDLDELDALEGNCALFSLNRFNLLSFYDADHFRFIRPRGDGARAIAEEHVRTDPSRYEGRTTRARVDLLLEDAGFDFRPARVCLLTNPRVFGYVFNPVSFYYCFDGEGNLRMLLTEVGNTFGDQKMYFTAIDDPGAKVHAGRHMKHFYVSPYIPFDAEFEWRFSVPDEDVTIRVDSVKDGDVVLRATFTGRRMPFSDRSMLWLQFRYPFLTAMIIFRIHYQALRLFLKRLRFLQKGEEDEKILQKLTRAKQ